MRLFSAVYYIMKIYTQTSLQRTPTVSKKVSSITMCLLYRVLNFFKEKIIVDKNLTIFYVICDSLQLPFLKTIWIVHFGTLCNLSVFIYPKFIQHYVHLLISMSFSKTLHSIHANKGFRCCHLSNIQFIISNFAV